MNVIELHRPSPHVAEVWLNRPEVRNAFNEELIAALTQTFASLLAEPGLRAIVLGARGKAFCAGADLNWMRAMADYSWEQNRADAQKLADMLWTIDQCPVPIIGRIQGDCYAGGMGLARVERAAADVAPEQLARLRTRTPSTTAAGCRQPDSVGRWWCARLFHARLRPRPRAK